MDVQIPTRTAGEIKLSDGTPVWVQTLSSLFRAEADKAARKYAQGECRDLLKGRDGWREVENELLSQDADTQARYIVSDDLYKFRTQADVKFPAKPEPDQGDDTPEVYTQKCLDWEQAELARQIKYNEFVSELIEAAVSVQVKLSPKDRREAAHRVHLGNEFYKAYMAQMPVETLLRAVRTVDDHTARFYRNEVQIKDTWDTDGLLLWAFYQSLDLPGGGEAVPTSAASS